MESQRQKINPGRLSRDLLIDSSRGCIAILDQSAEVMKKTVQDPFKIHSHFGIGADRLQSAFAYRIYTKKTRFERLSYL